MDGPCWVLAYFLIFGPSSLKGVSSIHIEDNIYKNEINIQVGSFFFLRKKVRSWLIKAYFLFSFFGPSSPKGTSSVHIEDHIYKNKKNTQVWEIRSSFELFFLLSWPLKCAKAKSLKGTLDFFQQVGEVGFCKAAWGNLVFF